MGAPRTTFASFLLLLPVGLAGCQGHGTYTAELLEESQQRLANLRAATDFDLAMQQFQAGDLTRGLESVNRSIEGNARVPQGHLLKGRIQLERGRSDDARAALARGIELDAANPEIHYYLGIVEERVGRLEPALASYRAAATLEPASPQYALAAAEVLMSLGRLGEARAALESRSADVLASAGCRQTLGHIALMEGRFEDAVRLFSEANIQDPGDPVLREDLCRAQMVAGQYAPAATTLRQLLEGDSHADRRDLQFLLGECLIELDRPVEARRILLGLTEGAGASEVEAWLRLIPVAAVLRDEGLLRMASHRLIALAPRRYEGYLARALWQRWSGDVEGALRSADRAVDMAGDDPSAARLKVALERQLGRS